MKEPKMRVISLGAGVQSSTMALMAARGDIGPMPDCAIFADTGWEPKRVYEWLAWLEAQLPFPVHHVSGGNIREHILAKTNSTGQRFASVPWYTSNGGMGRRQCTKEYKLVPIDRKQRELLGYQKGERIPAGSSETWIGISTDEIPRMKDARNKWQVNRWPLIEARMSRQDCLKWMAERQYPTPEKSSCIGCPYHTDFQWREMKDSDPESWNDAVAVDHALRESGPSGKMRYEEFMHRSLKPISEVDLSTPSERGQIEFGFLQECDGMCGL
jgi:hypothetical protein